MAPPSPAAKAMLKALTSSTKSAEEEGVTFSGAMTSEDDDANGKDDGVDEEEPISE